VELNIQNIQNIHMSKQLMEYFSYSTLQTKVITSQLSSWVQSSYDKSKGS